MTLTSKSKAARGATGQQHLRPCGAEPAPRLATERKLYKGWPNLWAKFKVLIGIFSQRVGPMYNFRSRAARSFPHLVINRLLFCSVWRITNEIYRGHMRL
jgi:hypothetical protein